jgi:hypothetical protein
MRLYVMAWEEIISGWDIRPDGWSVHISPDAYDDYLRRHWALHEEYLERRNMKLPLEYSRPISNVELREFDIPDDHALSLRLSAEKSLRVGQYGDDRHEFERLTGLDWYGVQ